MILGNGPIEGVREMKESNMAQKIKVNKDANPTFRPNTAREAYWEMIKKHNGRTLENFVTRATENPPSLPKSGKPEPVSGWVNFFRREGLIELED